MELIFLYERLYVGVAFLFGSKIDFGGIEYWIHFKARFGGVHAFGYNSAESEPNSMKTRAL